ncbi:MAG: patatin-like phospholipase family protein [Rhizobiales bacterium]|nr:patatin-like phospholipase family protein [Hyphomicrobiales bacterium]
MTVQPAQYSTRQKPPSGHALEFDQLVFSGGGTRCFWQGGFLDVVKDPLTLKPERISSVSGGGLAGCCYIAGRGHQLLDVMGKACRKQRHNVEIDTNELKPVVPHQEIFREVVTEVLDADAIAAIADGPAFQITLARPARSLPRKLAAILAITLYEVDQHTRSSPHMAFPAAIGTRQLVVDARAAARDGQIIDLVCAAAVIPPIFDMPTWPPGRADGHVLDAGTFDNAPMPQPDIGRTLVLLTRRYRNIPHHPDRLYVAPSRGVSADKIDFTSRTKIEDTWDEGIEDGKTFLRHHNL